MNPSKIQLSLAAFALVCTVSSCTETKEKTTEQLVVKGSETMLPLFAALGDKYNESSGKQISFNISGGGSQAGIKALQDGLAQVCMSSKAMTDDDRYFFSKNNKPLREVPLALDAIVIGVNSKNPVGKLTIEQLQKIYTGEINNWAKLGGENTPIVPLTREEGSGSLSFFKDRVMGDKNFGSSVKTIADAPSLVKELDANGGGIAFFGSAHKSDSVKLLEISKDGGATFIAPDENNVRGKFYPFVIPLNIYYVAANADTVVINKFINFAKGKSGRYKITDMGFTPVLVKD